MQAAISSTTAVVRRLAPRASGWASVVSPARRSLHVSRPSLLSEKSPLDAKVADAALTSGAQALRKSDVGTLKSGEAVPSKVADLASSILSLNLIEAMQLSEVLKSRLGVPDTAMPFGAPMMMAAPAAAAAAPAAAPAAAAAAPAAAAPAAKEEKTHVDIKLKAFKAEQKIKVIKEVRAVTNLGLKEVRNVHG
jgi:large subunit ribosomal protein L7/L12